MMVQRGDGMVKEQALLPSLVCVDESQRRPSRAEQSRQPGSCCNSGFATQQGEAKKIRPKANPDSLRPRG